MKKLEKWKIIFICICLIFLVVVSADARRRTTSTSTPTPAQAATSTPVQAATATPAPTSAQSTATPVSGGGGGTEWVCGVYYAAGTVVTYLGNTYTALVSHTAWCGANWNPADSPTLWTLTGSGGGGTTATNTPTPQPANTPTPVSGGGGGGGNLPSRVFAPYVDVCLWPTFSLTNCYSSTGQRYFTLAFIIADATNQPSWGGAYKMSDNHMMSDISSLRSSGGDVIISFGGANGFPIAYVITDVNALVSAYQAIINQYGVTWIDLDIEGWWVAETASIDRRNTAIARLQSANPGLRVTYCLPVLPSGLTQDGLNVINNAKSHGVNIYNINVMAMDYGAYEAPNGDGGMGGYAINAGTSTRNQTGNMIGVTPMIGYNDVQGEIFYLDDAQELLSWAKGTSYVNMLAMWSATRDNGGCSGVVSPSCSGLSQSSFAFINVFKSFSN